MNKLSKINNSSRQKLVVQKLDQQIKSFDFDPNTQIRWIWELIQNAKDAPNQFNAKIKQQVNDTHFISSHNGNAFQIHELHSIVDQYSTKEQKNSNQVKTTGKYGTGFITTYILSRIVTISGILKVQHQIAQDEQVAFNQNAIEKNPDEQNKDQMKQQASCQINYKKFSIQIDRSYKDRDTQLLKKVQITQKRLQQIVNLATKEIYQQKHLQSIQEYSNRTADSYSTTFAYKIVDKNKESMIQKAVDNVRSLICYAMLFNPNIDYYEFIDNRKEFKNISFSIKRKSFHFLWKGICQFSYEIKTQYDHSKKSFKNSQLRHLVCVVDEHQTPIAAIPILKIDKKHNNILRVDQSLPQIFKDFPLIGSSPLNWNCVINSSRFYPDEKRSGLMLSTMDQSLQQKVLVNRIQLEQCFQSVKNLYVFLAQTYCAQQRSLQNILICSDQNQLTKLNPSLQIKLSQCINQILQINFIPAKFGQKSKKFKTNIKSLNFLYFYQKKINQQQLLKLSKQVNQLFGFLFPGHYILDTQYYEDYYNILKQGGKFQQYCSSFSFITYLSLQSCLQQMEKNDYNHFKNKNKDNPNEKLYEIYSLIRKSQIQALKYNIYLNQNNQFNSIAMQNLKIKKTSALMEDLCDNLNICYKSILLNDFFTKCFENWSGISKLQDNDVVKDIHQMFTSLIINPTNLQLNQKEKNLLHHFVQFLLTLQALPKQTISNIKKLQQFQDLESFKAKNEKSHSQLSVKFKQVIKQLKDHFCYEFIDFLKILIQKYKEPKQFAKNCLKSHSQEAVVTFVEQLLKDSLFQRLMLKLEWKLNWNGVFVNSTSLCRLFSDVQYPNKKELQIYNMLKNAPSYNHYLNVDNAQNRLIHPIYHKFQTKECRTITIAELFSPIKQFYNSLEPNRKYFIIKYVDEIFKDCLNLKKINRNIEQKIEAWKEEIQNNFFLLVESKKNQKIFQDQGVKNFLFDLIENQTLLKKLKKDYESNGHNLSYLQELPDELKAKPRKKNKTE